MSLYVCLMLVLSALEVGIIEANRDAKYIKDNLIKFDDRYQTRNKCMLDAIISQILWCCAPALTHLELPSTSGIMKRFTTGGPNLIAMAETALRDVLLRHLIATLHRCTFRISNARGDSPQKYLFFFYKVLTGTALKM